MERSIDDYRIALQTALDALPKTPLEKSQIAWLAAIAYSEELAGRKRGRPRKNSPPAGYSKGDIARQLGISESLLDEAVHVEREMKDEETRDKIAAGKLDVGRAYDQVTREERNAKLLANVKALSSVEGRYQIIVADPPWQYENDGGSRAAEAHYPTSNTAILDLASDVQSKATDDAILLMWAVSPQLPFAMEVVKAWGFDYKQTLVWNKTGRLGLGSIFRVNTEFVIVATRGNGVRSYNHHVPNIIDAPVGEHSEKPQPFYDIVESMWPTASKLELFARNERPGWAIWGAEAPPIDEGEAA